MSTVPAEIAGIGSTSQKLRVSPGFDPLKAAVGPDEYFVLSRIDGDQTLRDILNAIGLPVDRAIAIVTRLRSIGALLLPGETAAPNTSVSQTRPGTAPYPTVPMPPKLPSRPPTGTGTPTPSRTMTPASISSRGTASTEALVELSHDLSLQNPTAEEVAALAEESELADNVRRRILAMWRLLERGDPFTLLGVSGAADPKTLKRAYFQLSKEIHPDRYYGRKLGSFADRMIHVFEATSRAYNRLTGSDKARASSSHPAVRSPERDQPQTPQEYAAELFDRACQLEVGGDALSAMKLFAAAVRVDPQTKYLRRATSCALAANQPRSAVEYAKKAHSQAPNDVSSARLLAEAFRAAGKLSDAEEVLVMAMAMKSENDVLTAELRKDLAEIRRMLSAP